MNSKAFWILTVSLFALCLGEPECDKNQCKDLWTAKKCNKVKYCIEEEWSKIKPTGNRDSVCEICLRMVKEARDTLRSNETREQLLQVFEGSCSLLYLKPAVELCDDFVDQFVPELVDILSSQMDPEAVCSVAKLCNNEVFAAMLKNSKACIYCESFTEALSSQMKALSSDQFKNGIINRCKNAGSFSDACYYISSIYSDSFYNNSKSILNNKPCEATSLCPSGFLHPQSIVKIKKKMCPLCRNVMTSLKKQLLNVKSSEEFVENMFKICEKFNFPHSTCLKVSNPALYEKLKNYDTLNLLCRMSFCGEKPDEIGFLRPLVPSDDESFSLTRELDPLELLENFEMFFPEIKQEKTEIRTTTEAVRPTISYGDPVENPVFFAPALPSLADEEDCKTCSHVLGMLESGHFKKGNSGEMFNICDTAENVGLCKAFVNNFSHILSMAATQGFATRKICEDLLPSCVIKRDDNPQPTSGSYCNLCLNTMNVLKQVNPVYWSKVEGNCKNMPEDYRGLCKYVFSNLPSYLGSSSEAEICDFNFKLCGPSAIKMENVTDVELLIKLNKSEICKTCISSLEHLVEMAKKNNSALIMRVVLEAFCYTLPHEEKRMCTHFIDVVGVEKILDFLKNINPSDVCDEIHLCKSKGVIIPESILKETTVSATNTKIPCKFCLMAIRTLLDQLQNDRTEDAIRKALDGLCEYLPEETRDTCRTLINEYTEDLIDMITADFNASEICMYLKICPQPKLSVVSISVESGEGSHKNDYVVFDIQTNQVLDWNEKPTAEPRAVEKPTPMDLEKLHEYVKECALCEALVGVINSHDKMMNEDYDFTKHSQYICSIVPKKDMEKCKSLLISYGPSIRNLLGNKKVNINEVCVYIDLCDPKMQAKVNQPVSVSEAESKVTPEENECAKGPRFWCANAENAEKCGTFLHCQETVWKTWENPPKRPSAH